MPETNILKTKDLKGLYINALGIALVKSFEERLLAKFVGNGNWKSGLVKGIIGAVIPPLAKGNKWATVVAQAFIIDSAEDFVNEGMNRVGAGFGGFGGSQETVI